MRWVSQSLKGKGFTCGISRDGTATEGWRLRFFSFAGVLFAEEFQGLRSPIFLTKN